MTEPTTERLRIGVVTDTPIDARHLEGIGACADLVLLTPQSLVKPANVWPTETAVRLVRLRGGRATFPFRLAAHLRRHRRDLDAVLVVDDLTAALGANLARLAAGPPVVILLGRPVLEYVRCQRRPGPRWLGRYALAWLLVQLNDRLADGIETVSHHVADEVRSRNDRVEVIAAYGVDVDAFGVQIDRDEARARLGLPLSRPVVLWRSRVAPEKDPATFVEAIGVLRRTGRELTAVYQGGEHEAMGAIADDHGVDIHLADRVDDLHDMVWWYRAADVVVQTSHAEGLGMSPLEALACETPVVATDVGGLPEALDHGRCGILVPPGDVAATADAIGRLLDDPDLRTAFGRNGREHVVTNFRDSDMFRARLQLLAAVAHRGAKR